MSKRIDADALREAQKRVREYLRAHEGNPFMGDQIQGQVGMNGQALLRASDVKLLLYGLEERK